MNFFCRSGDLTNIPNIECYDVLLYFMGPCGWNTEQLRNYKTEKGYCLVGHLDKVKAAYYAQADQMYFYLRSTCKSQTRPKVYDIWVLVKNTGEIMTGRCTCKA